MIPPTSRAGDPRVESEACGTPARVAWLPVLLLGAVAVLLAGLVVAVALGWLRAGPPGEAGFFLWPIFPFGFFLVFLVLCFGVRWFWWGGRWGGYPYGHDRESAEGLARQRYARGEISREQLRELLAELARTPLPAEHPGAP